MTPKTTKAVTSGTVTAFKNQSAGQRIGLTARSLSQPPPSTQSLIAAIDRLCARALALAFFDLDCSAEIEVARRLAVYAERRAE